MPAFRRLFTTALLASLAALLAGCQPDSESVDGKTWQVINYWASWCGPCREEIPALNQLDAAREDIVVLGVNYDGLQGDALAADEEELGVEFATLPEDPAEKLGQPRPRVLPTTFIVNPESEVVEVLTGPQTEDSILAIIDRPQG